MLNANLDFDREICELLVSSGFLPPHELDKALMNCRETGARLKDVVLDNRMSDPQTFSAAREVIEQVRQARLPVGLARSAFYLVGGCHMTIEEALAKLGVLSTQPNPWQKQLSQLAENEKWS